eukprot:3585138-Amphidinium_carterae.1
MPRESTSDSQHARTVILSNSQSLRHPMCRWTTLGRRSLAWLALSSPEAFWERRVTECQLNWSVAQVILKNSADGTMGKVRQCFKIGHLVLEKRMPVYGDSEKFEG